MHEERAVVGRRGWLAGGDDEGLHQGRALVGVHLLLAEIDDHVGVAVGRRVVHLAAFGLVAGHLHRGCELRAPAGVQRVEHLRGGLVGALDGHAVDALLRHGQYGTVGVGDVLLDDHVLVEFLGEVLRQVCLDGVLIVCQRDGALLDVGLDLDPLGYLIGGNRERLALGVADDQRRRQSLVGVVRRARGGFDGDGHGDVGVHDAQFLCFAGLGDRLLDGRDHVRRVSFLALVAFRDDELLGVGVVADVRGDRAILLLDELLGQVGAQLVVVGRGGQPDVLLGERVDAGEHVAGFRVQQVAHGLLDVDGHAEFVEARLDVVALGIGDGDGRIGHSLVDDAGELAFGLAHDADVAESDARGDAVLEIPVRAEECGHQQHQHPPPLDEKAADSHKALGNGGNV